MLIMIVAYTLELVTLLLALFLFAVHVSTHEQQRPVEFYRTRPDCRTARAFDLPSSWSTPMSSGMTVWICE